MELNYSTFDETSSTIVPGLPNTTNNAVNTFFIVLNFIVGIIGLAGNMIVCTTVLRSKFLHDITHYLIASLAMSDFLCCLFFTITTMFVAEGHPFPVNISSGFVGEFYCRLFWNLHLFWSAFFASAFNLVVVTFERYLAIVHPFVYARAFTVRRGLMLAASAWTLAFILELEFPIRSHYNAEINDCDFRGLGAPWFAKMMFIKSFTVSFVLPLIFLLWAYYKIIKTLRAGATHQDRQGTGQQAAELHRASRKVVQSLLIITTLFIILLLPSEMGNVLLLFDVSIDFTGSQIGNIFRTTTVLNSVVNPMIYAVKYRKFRRAMKATMCPCVKNIVGVEDTTSTADTG
ncbi:adenosine receptor A2b-like [Asterias rubens]|uniref:adenosine receptor A2b-like n=1 Tax=Asterias rubens TaxID=7604 RepID=UPI001455A802|nr:adenosine receptor A2b-like [Asterias rubens]